MIRTLSFVRNGQTLFQTAKRAQLRDPLSESTPCLCTCTVLFFLLVNILLASLLSVFVEILFCKAKGPGPLSLTTGLVARICCFRHRHPAQSLAGNPGPAPRHCRSRPPEISTIRTVVLTLGSGTCQIPEAWGAGQLGGIWPLV